MAKYGDLISGGGTDQHIPDDFAGLDSPKLKFNFTMSIQYSGMNAETGNDAPYEINFGIKQITRPAPNIIYEDVNFYNFMTKVATKVDFGVVTVTLYDDRNNRAHSIFRNYMEAISPITNTTRDRANLLDLDGQTTSATLGPLSRNARHGPIKNIRVNHITDHKGGRVVYDFLNPKIQNVTLDELDMTQSDVNTITFTFLYDSYHVETIDSALGDASVESVQAPAPNLLGEVNVLGVRQEVPGAESILVDNNGFPRLPGISSIPSIPGLSETAIGRQIDATLRAEGERAVSGIIARGAPNVPAISNALRNQSYIDGIPSQVLSNVLRRLTGG